MSESEFERNKRLRGAMLAMDRRMRVRNEASMREVLDAYHPGGVPDGLAERLCLIANALIKEIVHQERAIRDLHDGINRIKNEADLRWVDGFEECARQVRRFGEEAGLTGDVIDGLLRNHILMRQRAGEARNEEASRQVEWKRS